MMLFTKDLAASSKIVERVQNLPQFRACISKINKMSSFPNFLWGRRGVGWMDGVVEHQ